MNNRNGHLTRRVLEAFRSATPEELEEGLGWYEASRTFAMGMADRYDLTLERSVGIIAALSPRVRWARNMLYADQLCREGYAPVLRLFLARALAIRDGAEPLDVLRGPKVLSFYDNILNPTESEAVTVDRHACDLAMGIRGDDRTRDVLERKGGYEMFVAAYRSAAEILGVRPSQVQAVTWVVWRNRWGVV
jgi:hypothetical protein